MDRSIDAGDVQAIALQTRHHTFDALTMDEHNDLVCAVLEIDRSRRSAPETGALRGEVVAVPVEPTEAIRDAARFLLDRLFEFDGLWTDIEEQYREYCGHVHPAAVRLRDALAAAPASPSPAAPAMEPVAVKPLEWYDITSPREDGPPEPTGDVAADTMIGEYSICLDPDENVKDTPWCTWSPIACVGFFADFDEAKAAAQADYESRIRSALVAPPTPSGLDARTVEACVNLTKHLTVFSVEEDEGTIRLSLFGVEFGGWNSDGAKGIALLKLAAALRSLPQEGQ